MTFERKIRVSGKGGDVTECHLSTFDMEQRLWHGSVAWNSAQLCSSFLSQCDLYGNTLHIPDRIDPLHNCGFSDIAWGEWAITAVVTTCCYVLRWDVIRNTRSATWKVLAYSLRGRLCRICVFFVACGPRSGMARRAVLDLLARQSIKNNFSLMLRTVSTIFETVVYLICGEAKDRQGFSSFSCSVRSLRFNYCFYGLLAGIAITFI